jgi:hypothetical protein
MLCVDENDEILERHKLTVALRSVGIVSLLDWHGSRNKAEDDHKGLERE